MHEIIFGINTINSLININCNNINQVFIVNSYKINNRLVILFNKLKKNNIKIILVKKKWLDKKSIYRAHQGCIAEIISNKIYDEKYLTKIINNVKKIFILVLDSITDPHNFGACLRSANAAGVNIVIIPKNRSVKLNETVKKVASGASESIPIVSVINLSRTLQFLKLNNIKIIGSSHTAKSILFNVTMDHPAIALIVGSEEKGMRYLTSKQCDEIVKIPMFGSITSLNVSVTAGIILFEIVRQRTINI